LAKKAVVVIDPRATFGQVVWHVLRVAAGEREGGPDLPESMNASIAFASHAVHRARAIAVCNNCPIQW
jgi:hypothetical protein